MAKWKLLCLSACEKCPASLEKQLDSRPKTKDQFSHRGHRGRGQNPKSEARNTPQDTLWWKQIRMKKNTKFKTGKLLSRINIIKLVKIVHETDIIPFIKKDLPFIHPSIKYMVKLICSKTSFHMPNLPYIEHFMLDTRLPT